MTSLLELVPDKRLMNVIEVYLAKDDLLLKTPDLQKIRDEEREEERRIIAKNMKQVGIEVQLIASTTGLNIEEIKKL